MSADQSQDKWDLRFLELARSIAQWSKDPSTQTGAVIVAPDRTIISVGYNGFPQNMPDKSEWYADRAEKYSRIVHCEMNALLHAHRSVEGCTLYTWPFMSCDRCAVHMLQRKISRFVAPTCPADQLTRWADSIERTRSFFRDAGASLSEVAFT